MSVNRYTGLAPTQYSSMATPLPFNELAAIGERKQKQYDDASGLLDASKQGLILKGGYQTQDRANQFNQKITQSLGDLSKQFVEGKIQPQQLKTSITNLATQIQADPEYQTVKKDELYKENADKLFAEKNFSNKAFLNQWYDPKTGDIKQTQPGQQFSPGWYTSAAPVNFKKDHEDVYNDFKSQVKTVWGEDTDIQQDEFGRQIITKNGEEITQFTPKMAAELLQGFAADPENFNTRESVVYKSLLRQQQGQEYTPDDYLNDLVNNYFGYHQNKKELQQTKTMGVPPKGAGSRVDKPADGVPNKYLQFLDPKTTTVTNDALKGLFVEGDKKGTFKVSVSNETTPMKLAAIVNIPTADLKEFELVSKYKEKEKQLLENTENEKFKIPGYAEKFNTAFKELQKQVPDGKSLRSGYQGPERIWYYNDKGKRVVLGKESELLPDYKKELNKYKEGVKNSPELIQLQKELKDKHGIDVLNSKSYKKYDELTQKYGEEDLSALGNMLAFSGEVDFKVDPGEENKFNIDDKVFIKGKAVLSQSELDARFAQIGIEEAGDWGGGDWQDLFVDDDARYPGLIKAAGSKLNEKTGEYEDLYEVAIYKEVQDSQDVQDQFNKSYYGETVVGKNKAYWDQEFQDYKIGQFQQQQLVPIKKELVKYQDQLNADIQQLKGRDRAVVFSIFNSEILNEIDKDKKASRILQMQQVLESPELMKQVVDEYFNKTKSTTNTQGGGGGKKFQPTPATPLG